MKEKPILLNGQGESRRSFLTKTAAATATVAAANTMKTPVYGQSQAPSANVIGANDRIAVGYIGTGGQGQNHIRKHKEHKGQHNIVQAAVCDLYDKRLRQAQQLTEVTDANAYRDHRKLLERKDIDAIVVATIDNWHAEITKDTLESGKHVYCEKPMTRYLGEAFEVYDAVKKSGKVFMVGSQGCADPKYHQAAKWIKEGLLGQLVWAQSSYCRNNYPRNEWEYPIDEDANESNLDWNRWLGKVPKIPFTPKHFFSWHLYYDYNSGIIGNLLPHRFYPMMVAMGEPQFPVRVSCTGTRQVSTDREITDTTHMLVQFPNGLTFVLAGSIANEQGLPDTLRGQKATLYFASSQNKVDLKPERPFSDEIDPMEFSDALPVESMPRLAQNWFDCIRHGGTPLANIDLAIRGHVALCLCEMAERLNATFLFDEKTRTIRDANGKEVKPIDYNSDIPSHYA